MKIVKYTPELKIVNAENLPRGTGAKYLECISAHRPELPIIAKQWRRTMPTNAEIVVEF